MRKLGITALLAVAALGLPACAHQSELQAADPAAASTEVAANSEASAATQPAEHPYPGFMMDWTENPIDDRWYVSNHDLPEGHWASDFRMTNVNAYPTGLNIKMTSKRPPDGTWSWAGGEIQRLQRVSYGEYHAIMKAAPGSGLVTGFFTYTGDYYDEPHDEIDFEFIGKSPYEVQLNAFSDGESMGMVPYPVDFDTSKNYALYSFTWHPDSVTWYINGEQVYQVTSADFPIPETPGILIGNLFLGREKRWVGRANVEEGATAIFRCMSYRPLDDDATPTCADQYQDQR